MIDRLKQEVFEAGIRIGCAQTVRGCKKVLSKVFSNERAQSIINSKMGSGVLTAAIGMGLGRSASHDIAQAISHELRVQGLAHTGNGLVERLTGEEEKKA